MAITFDTLSYYDLAIARATGKITEDYSDLAQETIRGDAADFKAHLLTSTASMIMPLTEKGEKIKGAMEKQYGPEKGKEVFYASRNKGTITGVDDDERIPLEKGKSKEAVSRNTNRLIEKGHNPEAAKGIAERQASKGDDAQHMGFTEGAAEPVKKLVSQCDALAKRLDMFEARKHQRKPVKVEPRNKDNMQPSNRHPKEVPKV